MKRITYTIPVGTMVYASPSHYGDAAKVAKLNRRNELCSITRKTCTFEEKDVIDVIGPADEYMVFKLPPNTRCPKSAAATEVPLIEMNTMRVANLDVIINETE